MSASPIHRLDRGCGAHSEPGWFNAARRRGPQHDVRRDIRHELPRPVAHVPFGRGSRPGSGHVAVAPHEPEDRFVEAAP